MESASHKTPDELLDEAHTLQREPRRMLELSIAALNAALEIEAKDNEVKSSEAKSNEKNSEAKSGSVDAKNMRTLARAYFQVGSSYRLLGDLHLAEVNLRRAMGKARQIKEDKMIGSIATQLAMARIDEHRFEDALEYLTTARDAYQDANYQIGEAKVLFNIANVKLLRGKPSEALPFLQETLRIYTELNDKEGIAQAFASMGVLSKVEKRFEDAIRRFERSKEMLQMLDQRKNELIVETNLLECYAQLGKVQYAYSQAAPIRERAREQGFHTIECKALLIHAQLAAALGHTSECEQLSAEAKATAERHHFINQFEQIQTECKMELPA